MKKKTIIFGGVLIVLVIVIASIGLVAVKGDKLDAESKKYVDAVIVPIVSDWNQEELIRHASPEFKAAVTGDDLDKLFGVFRKLGKLKKYEGSEGQATMSISTQQGKIISASYVASAKFAAGPAKIKVNLIKRGKEWQIMGFNVDSEVFLDAR